MSSKNKVIQALEAEQVGETKRARFEELLARLDEAAAAEPFRPRRAAFEMRRCYNAGVAAGENPHDVASVIEEAALGRRESPVVAEAIEGIKSAPEV